MSFVTAAVILCAALGPGSRAQGQPPSPPGGDLERLSYNHPGLVVDLGVGLWASPLPMDFDADGDLDILCGEFLDRLSYFENVGDRKHPRYAKPRSQRDISSHSTSPTVVDWNRDGILDLLVGAEDGHLYYLRRH